MHLPPLTFELSLTQQFELICIKDSLHTLSREELETFLIDIIRQKYIIQNNFKQVVSPAQTNL